MRKLFLALCAVIIVLVNAPTHAAGPYGIWMDEKGKTKVKTFRCRGNRLCGKIIWLKRPLRHGKPKTDYKNKNKTLRNRKVIGLQIINGMKPKRGGRKWKGKIYNPDDGGNYRATLRLIGDKQAKVKGCFLFLCKTKLWTRLQ
ncbi:MAG: DUF2147 domain-containing protein [Hyphomicrobiales bacterium]